MSEKNGDDVYNGVNPSKLNDITNTSQEVSPTPKQDQSKLIKKGWVFALLIVVSLGTFQFGYSIGVFNTLQAPLAAKFGWNTFYYNDATGTYMVTPDSKNTQNLWVTVMTTICSVGSAFGAIFSGAFTKYGKWKCLMLTNILVVVGAGITLTPVDWVMTIGRFIYGVASGAFSVYVPLYINETAPLELKGPLGVMTQLFVTVGIMISFLLGLVIPTFTYQKNDDGEISMDQENYDDYLQWVDSWQVQWYYLFMFGMPILFALIQVGLLSTSFNYDTPKVLKQTGMREKLNQMMLKIYDESIVKERIGQIIIQDTAEDSQPTYKESLFDFRYKMATFIGIMLSVFQQLSGINAVMFYSSKMFEGASGISPSGGTALVGVVNMLSTLASSFLLSCFGRKFLMWTLSFVMAACLVGLGVSYELDISPLEITLTLLFVIFFEFSLGPIVWIYMSEVMTEKGVSLGTLANWTFTIVVAFLTPILIDSIGGYLFISFGVICFICAIFVLFLVKETKGLSNHEVANLYAKQKNYLGVKTVMEDEKDIED